MDLTDALKLASAALADTGLDHWTLLARRYATSYKFPQDRIPRCIALGYCNYSANTLILWLERIEAVAPEALNWDLRHLLAHALVADNGHSSEWRLAAEELEVLGAWDYAEPPPRAVNRASGRLRPPRIT